jgi:hypothetical protein
MGDARTEFFRKMVAEWAALPQEQRKNHIVAMSRRMIDRYCQTIDSPLPDSERILDETRSVQQSSSSNRVKE